MFYCVANRVQPTCNGRRFWIEKGNNKFSIFLLLAAAKNGSWYVFRDLHLETLMKHNHLLNLEVCQNFSWSTMDGNRAHLKDGKRKIDSLKFEGNKEI
jgi:hypothetical protein